MAEEAKATTTVKTTVKPAVKEAVKEPEAKVEQEAVKEPDETAKEPEAKVEQENTFTELDKVLGRQAEVLKVHNKMIKMHNIDVELVIGKGTPTERKVSLVDFAGMIKKQAG